MGSLKTSCATISRNVVTQKKKRLSLIRSVFLPRGLQSRNMILFLFPVTTSCSSKARATLWTSFIHSHSLTNLLSWLQRCFPSSEAWSLLTAPAGKMCPLLSLCLWAHVPELEQENIDTSPRKAAAQAGADGAGMVRGQHSTRVRGGPESGGIHPPMHIPTQAHYHGSPKTCLLPSWCRKVLRYGPWAGSYPHINTLLLTPYARDSKTEV